MFSPRAASSDSLSRQKVPSTPPATYLHNSAPSTPLPATLSTFKAQGFNWTTAQDPEQNRDFPWSLSSLTPRSVSPGNIEEEPAMVPELPNNLTAEIRSPISKQFTLIDPAQQKSPTFSKARHFRRLSGGRNKLSAKTTLRLHLPPVNQEALLQAALASDHVPRTLDASSTQNVRKSAQKLRMGVPADVVVDTEGNMGLRTADGILNVARKNLDEVIDGDAEASTNAEATTSLSGLRRSPGYIHGLDRRRTLAMLTPPDEVRDLNWQKFSSTWGQGELQFDQISRNAGTTKVQPVASTSITIPDVSASQQNETSTILVNTSVDAETLEQTRREKEAVSKLDAVLEHTLDRDDGWLKNALKAMFNRSQSGYNSRSEAIRIISHSLPCPLPASLIGKGESKKTEPDLPLSASAAPVLAAAAGYFIAPTAAARGEPTRTFSSSDTQAGITTALGTITSIIQNVYKRDENSVYVHVSHAISSSTPLSRLPSQPLTDSSGYNANSATSGSLHNSLFGAQTSSGGYFNPTVFNSIVIAPDTADTSIQKRSTMISPMPSPILPPFSLHYSLLERYIPPPTPTADAAFFSSNLSPLLDRVYELSSNGGSLLFIYPTKTGAKQFCDNYLGQVLDPLLRSLMVLHRLKDDLLWNISKMTAVHKMQEFPGLERRVKQFCKRLSDEGPSEAANNSQSKLVIPIQLIHSEKVQVHLNQHSWREWWAQQEQNRIREVIKNHFSQDNTPNRNPFAASQDESNSQSTTLAAIPQYNGPSDLAREIIDGVKASTTRPSSPGMGDAVKASAQATGASSSCWGIMGSNAFARSQLSREEEGGIEVGVFVLRRGG